MTLAFYILARTGGPGWKAAEAGLSINVDIVLTTGNVLMAEETKELDLEEGEEAPKSKKMLFIIIGVVVLAAGGGGAFFLLAGDPPGEAEELEMVATKQQAIYIPLVPPFVVTYHTGSRQRMVQVSVSLMTRNGEVPTIVEQHMPLIRNNLISVFGQQEFEEIKTPEGKDVMRDAALEEIQMIVEEELGVPGIEQVLFTNFVIQ